MSGTSRVFPPGASSPPRAGWGSCSLPTPEPRGRRGHPDPVGQAEQQGRNPAGVTHTHTPQLRGGGSISCSPEPSPPVPGLAGARGRGGRDVPGLRAAAAPAAFSTRESSGTARRGAGGGSPASALPGNCPRPSPCPLGELHPPGWGTATPPSPPEKPPPLPYARRSPSLPRRPRTDRIRPPRLPRPLSRPSQGKVPAVPGTPSARSACPPRPIRPPALPTATVRLPLPAAPSSGKPPPPGHAGVPLPPPIPVKLPARASGPIQTCCKEWRGREATVSAAPLPRLAGGAPGTAVEVCGGAPGCGAGDTHAPSAAARPGWEPGLGAATHSLAGRASKAALAGQIPRVAPAPLPGGGSRRAQLPAPAGLGTRCCPCRPGPAEGPGAPRRLPTERTVPRGSALRSAPPAPPQSFPEKRGWGQPARPHLPCGGEEPAPSRSRCRSPPGASLPAAPEGRSPGRRWARLGWQGGSQSSLRPFIPASPKRIRFDVQPGFLWVWSEPVQPSLGDTLLSKSYIFYITSFPAWLFFPLPPRAGEHRPPPLKLPHQLKRPETPPGPHLLPRCSTAPGPASACPEGAGAQPALAPRQLPPCPQKAAAPRIPPPSWVVLGGLPKSLLFP